MPTTSKKGSKINKSKKQIHIPTEEDITHEEETEEASEEEETLEETTTSEEEEEVMFQEEITLEEGLDIRVEVEVETQQTIGPLIQIIDMITPLDTLTLQDRSTKGKICHKCSAIGVTNMVIMQITAVQTFKKFFLGPTAFLQHLKFSNLVFLGTTNH